MRALLRFSAAVAFSRDRRQRWRQLCVVGASAIAAFIALLAVGLVSLAITSPIRAGSMLGVPTDAVGDEYPGSSPDGAVVATVDRGTLAMGRQVPTVWLEPLPGHEDDPAAVPPGLDSLLAPGEAVLSPALVAAGYTAEDLGWHSSTAGSGADGAIGDDGLAAASEPLIFVRPAAGTTLSEGGAVTYLQTFAASDPNAVYGGNSLDPEVVGVGKMAPGVVVFLLIPAFILLVSSTRARSLVRDDRLRFLHVLGVRTRRARTAMACETGLLAVSGGLVAVAAHALLGRWITVIPGTSIRLFPGDLAVPWWVYPPTVLAVVACAMICGALGRITPRHRTPHRRARRRRASSTVSIVALSAAILTVIVSATPWVPPGSASTIYIVGTIAAIVVLPFAVPALAAAASTAMQGVRSPVLWAAARRVRHDTVHLSRVASVLGVLIVVISFAVALWGSATATQAERSTSGSSSPASSQPFSVGWRGVQGSGIDAARDAFAEHDRDVLLVPTLFQDDSNGPMPLLVDVGTDDCPAFVEFFGGDAPVLCATGHESELADFAELSTGMRTPEENTAPLPDQGPGTQVVIYAAGPPAGQDPLTTQEVQKTLGFLPALNIDLSNADLTAPLPLAQWLVAGALAAFVLLGLAVVREIGDRSVEDADRDLLLQRLGLSLRRADQLAWATLLIPLVVSTATAFACSIVIAYAGEVLQIADGDLLKLTLVAAVSLTLPLVAILVTIPVRRATSLMARR